MSDEDIATEEPEVVEIIQQNQAESGAITQTQTVTGEDCSM